MTKPRRRRPRSAVPLRIREAILHAVVREGQPTPERAQHGAVDRGGAVSHVRALHEAGRIDDAQRAACLRLHDDWAIGIERVREPPQAGPGGAVDDQARELRHLVAAERYRRAMGGVGTRRAAILLAVVCCDVSWRELGRRIGASDKTALAVAAQCIADLTAWYQVEDGRRKHGAP